ncbi:hypothetical protein MO387_20540 [Shewanella sp. N2AIL]|uniref:hypothetical protein n=1 Tax=Shewanella sp. N2AIL TaxID=2926851 RepID=UPI001F56D252|nr:hypothetical protein [Shewanella sp. N2AIL]MCI2965442.1 hypothetical protein [Shewanella sp. N2AIL]
MSSFQRLPTWWFRQERLKNFNGGKQIGESIASLKVLACIALHIDYKSLSAKISISDIEVITGLSRPMVMKGIYKLEKEEMVVVDREWNTNLYTLTELHEDSNWAKMPSTTIKTNLKNIPNRGIAAFGALKIYLSLLALRDNSSQNVKISYEKIREWTGLQSCHIRSSLDVLYNHSFIHIYKSEELDFTKEDKHAHNVYKIVGNLLIR